MSPEGTTEDVVRFQPSLRDFEIIDAPIPNVETLGYFQSSLRDEDAQILVALDRAVRSFHEFALDSGGFVLPFQDSLQLGHDSQILWCQPHV